MKRKRRPLIYIAPPTPVAGVEIALAYHLLARAEVQTEALEMLNAPVQDMANAIAVENDMRNRFIFNSRLRVN